MFTYFHSYHPRVWEAQVRRGLIDARAGIRFCQSLLLPPEDKFNELAGTDGALFAMERAEKLPLYIDRLQGGCYFEGYAYDKALVNAWRELLGDGFYGYQMHEWMSNLHGDHNKIRRNIDGPWSEEGIRRAILKAYPYPCLMVEAMSAAELAEAGEPHSLDEFMAQAASLFERRQRETDGLLIPCDSFAQALQLEIKRGAKRFMPEIGAQTPDTRLQIAYARGMARTHGLSFGAYYEPWGGKPFSACCYQRDGLNEWGIGQSSDFPFVTCGENGGSSRSMQERMQLYAYLAGAEFMAEEWGMCNTFYDWKDFELSPYGQVKREFLSFVDRFPDRGDMFAPIAVVLPSEMDVIYGIRSDKDTCFDYAVTGAQAETLRRVRHALRQLFVAPTPMLGTEVRSLINSDMPDAFDVVHEDGASLDRYDYLIDLTGHKGFAAKHKNACAPEDALALLRGIMPCWVEGGLHWFVNRVDGGWRLAVFNHSGIERTVEKGELRLDEARKTAVVTLGEGASLRRLAGSEGITLQDGRWTISLGAGEWFWGAF